MDELLAEVGRFSFVTCFFRDLCGRWGVFGDDLTVLSFAV
jgi:hypothetical protein